MRFEGKTVVVTGGTGALGTAVVEGVVREGGRCVVPVHRLKEMPRVAGPGSVEYVGGVDLTDEGAVAGFYEKAGADGGIWASVHTAGGFAMGPIAEMSRADYLKMMETNALTAFLCCREAIKAMRRGGYGGRIVNVAAKVGLTPVGGMTAYVASKSALVGMTLGLAEEVAGEGIWVNAVAPSIMDTAANRASFPAGTDFSKWPSVAEVAATILFLASPENRVTRGAVAPVYGRT